jgi:hypothetical protein
MGWVTSQVFAGSVNSIALSAAGEQAWAVEEAINVMLAWLGAAVIGSAMMFRPVHRYSGESL